MAKPHRLMDKVMPAGMEKLLKALFEDVPERLAPKVMGKGVQGVEIHARLIQKARESVCTLDNERYMHDGYLVYLHPTDYDALRALFDQIKRDALKHLEATLESSHCQTRSRLTLEFLRATGGTSPGVFWVDSYYKVDGSQTVMYMPGQTKEKGMCFKAEGFEADKKAWPHLYRVFDHMEIGRFEQALDLIRDQDLDQTLLGGLLRVLCLFQSGRFDEGLRILNLDPQLNTSEHGLYLKALAYLQVADGERAETWWRHATRESINPMGCLIAGLLDLHKGDRTQAAKQFQLAGKDPALQDAVRRYAPLAGGKRATSANPADMIRLRGQDGADVLIILSNLITLDRVPDAVAGERALPAARKPRLPTVFNRGSRILVKGAEITVSGSKPPPTGRKLENGDEIAYGSARLYYRKLTFQGDWGKETSRDFEKPCHVLAPAMSKARWLLPADRCLTVGRASGCGNDLVLEEDCRITTKGHALLYWNESHFGVRDLNSTNGTFVNGQRLPPGIDTVLKAGDTLQMGEQTMVVELVTFD